MTVFVFLGPTLPVAEAQEILDAPYLPPVVAGDVCALVARRPRAIGIIDGLFEQVPSVRYKEILYALSLFETENRRRVHPAVRGLLYHPAPEVRRKAAAHLSRLW